MVNCTKMTSIYIFDLTNVPPAGTGYNGTWNNEHTINCTWVNLIFQTFLGCPLHKQRCIRFTFFFCKSHILLFSISDWKDRNQATSAGHQCWGFKRDTKCHHLCQRITLTFSACEWMTLTMNPRNRLNRKWDKALWDRGFFHFTSYGLIFVICSGSNPLGPGTVCFPQNSCVCSNQHLCHLLAHTSVSSKDLQHDSRHCCNPAYATHSSEKVFQNLIIVVFTIMYVVVIWQLPPYNLLNMK